jgi:hypothetical protein
VRRRAILLREKKAQDRDIEKNQSLGQLDNTTREGQR